MRTAPFALVPPESLPIWLAYSQDSISPQSLVKQASIDGGAFMPWLPFPVFTKEALAATRGDEKKARLLVDESLGIAVNSLLRKWSWNIIDVSEAALVGHPDENLFAYAQTHDRIILTHDEDFLNDRKYPLDAWS